jgi:hypothetical protein
MYINEMQYKVVDLINLAKKRDQWRALLNMVRYLRVP